jgi:hypothetical protein
MANRKTVGIKALSDRENIVAVLHEPGVDCTADEDTNPLLAAWARAGIVTLPKRPITPVSKSPARSPKGTAARLLDEGRRDRAS